MIQQSHFSVNIRSGLDGPIMQEYDSENARNTRFIEATTDATICPQIVIHKKFQWHGADGLYVAIRYGSKPYQVAFWVPKPSESFSDAEDDWSFQIPGKNILDKATKQLVGYEYRVADLNVSELQQIAAKYHQLSTSLIEIKAEARSTSEDDLAERDLQLMLSPTGFQIAGPQRAYYILHIAMNP